MERCERVEEYLENGERGIICYCGPKKIAIKGYGLISLLVNMGSIEEITECFCQSSLNRIEHYLDKNKIKYIES